MLRLVYFMNNSWHVFVNYFTIPSPNNILMQIKLCWKNKSTCTFTLLELKVIRVCHSIKPRQSAHLCSLTMLYAIGRPTSISHFDIPKTDHADFKNGRQTSPLKKFRFLAMQKLSVSIIWLFIAQMFIQKHWWFLINMN